MDYGKAFAYPFDDKEWVTKLLIGGILALIPIVNLVVLGYMLKVTKNVADGAEQPLPGWDDFADYFVKGLISFLGILVWALPALVVAGVVVVLGLAAGSEASADYSGPLSACVFGLNCLSSLYGLFLAAVLPAALTQYAVSGDFGAFFRFGEMFRFITSNLGNYVVAILLAWVAQFVAGFGVILCVVGVIFTQFWASLVGAHLFGQVYAVSTEPAPELTV